jgi:hypothetical protein
MNGIEVIEKIRAKIISVNHQSEELVIQEPNYVIVSAFMMPAFRKHLSKQ